MRSFVLLAQKGATEPFLIEDLPGSGGRMDLVARCVNSSLWLSGDIRRDTDFHVVLCKGSRSPVRITFFGNWISNISPDERNIASWINRALRMISDSDESDIQQGINVKREDLMSLIKGFGNRPIYILSQDGGDIREEDIRQDAVFILGDNKGLPSEYEESLINGGASKISIGPAVYLSSHCISVIHNELDRRGL